MDISIFKKNYYCLISGLPDLVFDNKIAKGPYSQYFRNDLFEQLSTKDRELAKLFYLQYDNRNLISIILKQDKPFCNLGNYSHDGLLEKIYKEDGADSYFANVSVVLESNSSLSNLENILERLFYSHVMKVNNSFVKEWFSFDRNMKNALAAVNCRTYDYVLNNHLIFNGDNEIYSDLIEKNPKDIAVLFHEVPYIDEILKVVESNASIVDKEKQLDFIRWKFLDEHTCFHYFTVEKVLSYIIKLEIVDRWYKVSKDESSAFLSKMIDELKNSYFMKEEIQY